MAKLKETTIPAIFQLRAEKYGDRVCVAYKKDGSYTDISWNRMNKMIRDLAGYLISIGVKKGDRVGLFSENRYEWWVADQAILSIGAVDVPIYATNSSAEASYILKNSESKACLVSTEDHLERVLKAKKNLPQLKNLIIFDELSRKKKDVITLSDALEKGEANSGKSNIDKLIQSVKPSDLATIMYTSGTTGDPKGVMLTHDNFVSNCRNVFIDIMPFVDDSEIFFSFLPLSHVLERTCGYYCAVYIGATVKFAESIETLLEDINAVRPTMVISVPRIYEKIRAGILAKVADASPIKKALFNFAVSTAKKNLPFVCERKPRSGLFKVRYNLMDKIVLSNLRQNIGMDRIKFAISGGAPLSITDAEFFIGMGIEILEGYGLTETSPITNYNRPGEIMPGTVGRALQETTVKIAKGGEIQIKGPQVMKGYYKNPKATKEVFSGAFFRTGDVGEIDEKGRLRITGRIKDIIVTAGGKNISPQNIESNLKTSRFIEQVAVIGDKRKYLSALIVPAFEELQKWARKNNIEFIDNDELIKNDEVNKFIESEIEKYTKDFARVEQIRKFKLLNAEWTQQTGELTPSQKVKRGVIETKYADMIEGMYPGE